MTVEPRSRRPRTSPGGRRTACATGSSRCGSSSPRGGLDAGPATIAWHLGREGLRGSRRPRPSGASSTPPGSSCPSRASARAAPGSGSRPPRPTSSGSPTSPTGGSRTAPRSRSSAGSTTTPGTCSAARRLRRVAGDDVVATFTAAGDAHGWPAATLTDNAAVYTSRFTGGRNGFEYLLAYLGIRQKNGAPGHPQTQGKIERFHQTLKCWLGRQPAAWTLAELQAQLDRFRLAYNEHRPHRAIGRTHPGRGLCGAAPRRIRPARRPGPLPPPLRHRRRQGRHHPAPGRPAAPPQHRRGPCPPAGPRHRRRARGHGRRPRHRRDPLDATASSPTRGTGATNDETPADGRGLSDRLTHMCRTCRDSCVADVATHDSGAGDGVRTRDIQLGKLTLCQLSYSRSGGPYSSVASAAAQPPCSFGGSPSASRQDCGSSPRAPRADPAAARLRAGQLGTGLREPAGGDQRHLRPDPGTVRRGRCPRALGGRDGRAAVQSAR